MNHGFRKFFDTVATNAGMNHIYVEWCEGHSLKGVKDSYFIPQADSEGVYREILEGNANCNGYLTAIDALTINEANRLRIQNARLSAEKNQIKALEAKVDRIQDSMQDSLQKVPN